VNSTCTIPKSAGPLTKQQYVALMQEWELARRCLDAAFDAPSALMCLEGCHEAMLRCLRADPKMIETPGANAQQLGERLDAFAARHPSLFRNPNLINLRQMASVPEQIERTRQTLALPAADDAPLTDRDTLCRDVRMLLDEVGRDIRSRRPSRRGLFAAATVVVLLAACGIYVWSMLPDLLRTQGILVSYYRGTVLKHPFRREVRPALLADYGSNSPAWFVPDNNYCARLEGVLTVPDTTNYDFFAQSDGGLRFWIDGQLVVDNWHNQCWERSAYHHSSRIEQGKHRVKVEYFKVEGRGRFRIRWAGGSVPDEAVIGQPYLTLH
jgi:hypothetical protein